jgi:hypothetical protein
MLFATAYDRKDARAMRPGGSRRPIVANARKSYPISTT